MTCPTAPGDRADRLRCASMRVDRWLPPFIRGHARTDQVIGAGSARGAALMDDGGGLKDATFWPLM